MSDQNSQAEKRKQPTPEEIALRAFGYYEQENFPENRDLDHWLRAEQELMDEHRSSDTPPAPWPPESGAGV